MIIEVEYNTDEILERNNRHVLLGVRDNGELKLDGPELTSMADGGNILHCYVVKVGPRGYLSLVEVK